MVFPTACSGAVVLLVRPVVRPVCSDRDRILTCFVILLITAAHSTEDNQQQWQHGGEGRQAENEAKKRVVYFLK